MPPRPTGRISSPSRQARTTSRPPTAGGDTATSPSAAEHRLHLPGAEAHAAGHEQLHRLRRLGSSRAGTNLTVPYSATAWRPPPRSSDLRAVAAEREHVLGLPARERARLARRPPRRGVRSTSRRSADGQLVERRERHRRGRRPPPASASEAAMSRISASSRSWRAVSRDRELGLRAECAQRSDHLMSNAGAREAGVGVRRVLAPLEVAGAQVLAHLLAGHLEQRPHQPPAPGLHAPAARGCRATPRAGRAPSRPGRWPCAPAAKSPLVAASASA